MSSNTTHTIIGSGTEDDIATLSVVWEYVVEPVHVELVFCRTEDFERAVSDRRGGENIGAQACKYDDDVDAPMKLSSTSQMTSFPSRLQNQSIQDASDESSPSELDILLWRGARTSAPTMGNQPSSMIQISYNSATEESYVKLQALRKCTR
jgi:hypothetical protein